METLLGLVLVYFIPTIGAFCNKHPHRNAIGLLNLFLGWTFVGWVGALVWLVIPVRSADPRCEKIR